MSDITSRIIRRVTECDDAELHAKLKELHHYRTEALPKMKVGTLGSFEVDADSFVGVMRGEGRAAGDRANALSSELAADLVQFGEDESRVSDWLFRNCDKVLDEIAWSRSLDDEINSKQRRTVLAIVLLGALILATGSYFPIRNYFPNAMGLSITLAALVFLLLLWIPLGIWKQIEAARSKKRGRLHRELLTKLRQSLFSIETGANQAAKEQAEAAFAIAKRVVRGVPWVYCFDVLGQALLAANDVDGAKQYSEEALEIARIGKDNAAEFSALSTLGRCQLQSEDRTAALVTFKAALEVAQRDNFPEFLERAKKNLALIGTSTPAFR
jgi:tetratricopeptide (TPR) repeat protein